MPRIARPKSDNPAPAEIPDRPLDPEADLPTVAIRASGQHPFVYRKMTIGPAGRLRPRDGDLVRVVDRDGIPLGYGLWNARSQINVRMLSRDHEPPGEAFWRERIGRAIGLRRDMLGVERETNAYRVIHAEADGLTGLIVDRFDDVLSVEVFSLGIYQRIGPILAIVGEQLGTKHFRVNVDERIALAEDFPGARSSARSCRRGSRSRRTASGSASSSRARTRPASFATSATIGGDWRSSLRDDRSSTSAPTRAASASTPSSEAGRVT